MEPAVERKREDGKDGTYSSLRRFNAQATELINQAWGEHVAWIEDRIFTYPSGSTRLLPVVVSKLVCGKLPGRASVPAFNAGPAVGRIK
jgi:hypothetical protein